LRNSSEPRGLSFQTPNVSLIVSPNIPGMRAYDYVDILMSIEKELRACGYKHIILVPAMGD